MIPPGPTGTFRLIVALLLGTLASVAPAQTAISGLPLQQQSDNQWLLPAGTYTGRFTIDQPLVLRCAEGAVLDAGGQGSALTITAPEVVVEGCQIRNWGRDLTDIDAGIYLSEDAEGALVESNHLVGPGFGIWVDGARGVNLLENRIEGVTSVRSQDRGNGIHLYQVSGARVVGNRISQTRDGIYISNSNDNLLRGNGLEDLRYGIHYMYSHDNRIVDNRTSGTRTGYALMQSRQLTVTGNRSEQDDNYGILMNYITYSTLRGNVIKGVSRGSQAGNSATGAEGKALFIYNSQHNTIHDNYFGDSTLGIHLTAGSEGNSISGNAFVDNQQQVKYVATRTQEWSVEGHGNYWSDYLGWDRNGDGVGDIAYEPNDNVDRLLWMYPQVRLLMNSPAIEVLRWVQRAFPVTKSPGVQDNHPLMQLPAEPSTEPAQESDA